MNSLYETISFSMWIDSICNIFLIKDLNFNYLLRTFEIIIYKLNTYIYNNLYIDYIVL